MPPASRLSVPNELFERAEHLARRLEVSRSELYSRALREYLARHSPDEVTEALDLVCKELDASSDDFVREASRRIEAILSGIDVVLGRATGS